MACDGVERISEFVGHNRHPLPDRRPAFELRQAPLNEIHGLVGLGQGLVLVPELPGLLQDPVLKTLVQTLDLVKKGLLLPGPFPEHLHHPVEGVPCPLNLGGSRSPELPGQVSLAHGSHGAFQAPDRIDQPARKDEAQTAHQEEEPREKDEGHPFLFLPDQGVDLIVGEADPDRSHEPVPVHEGHHHIDGIPAGAYPDGDPGSPSQGDGIVGRPLPRRHRHPRGRDDVGKARLPGEEIDAGDIVADGKDGRHLPANGHELPDMGPLIFFRGFGRGEELVRLVAHLHTKGELLGHQTPFPGEDLEGVVADKKLVDRPQDANEPHDHHRNNQGQDGPDSRGSGEPGIHGVALEGAAACSRR